MAYQLTRGNVVPGLKLENRGTSTRRHVRKLRASRDCLRCRAKPNTSSASVKMDDVVEEYEYSDGDLLNEEEGSAEPVQKVEVSMPEVKKFITNLCENTEVAELDLRVGDLELYVLRKIGETQGQAQSPPSPAPAIFSPPEQSQVVQSTQTPTPEEESMDESVAVLTCETVGTLRRGRYVKGKKIGSKNMVEEGDIVKKGQTIAFIEQMGTYTPVLSSQAGEIVKFESSEGDPIGYGQNLVHILPFFGGHIIGESKYA